MEESGNSSTDRISNLPEGLIHHILSFLDMRCVVQTCVLSKRWRYVWPTVSNLVFRGDAFGENGVEQLKKFKMFVNTVFMLRDFCDMHKFHLHWGNESYQTEKIVNKHLNTWVLAVLKCNVQDLSIYIESDDNRRCDHEIRFPHSLFNSQSLSKLVLEMSRNYESQVIFPESMHLPGVKFMSLSSFFVEHGDPINKLISSCPTLESLILRDIWIEHAYDTNVKIESHVLKHLEISNHNIEMLVCSHYNMAKIIKLSTPNLKSFICKDYMLQEYCIEDVSSLVTADIEILKECTNESLEDSDLEISEEERERLYPKRMVEFIGAFHKVKDLTISSPGFLQVLAGATNLIVGRSLQFCNLQCLKLTTWFTRSCLLSIIYLLKACPCLESLYLTSKKPDYRADKDDDEVELSVSCVLSHLKRIEIREVKDSSDTAGTPGRLKLVEEFTEKLRTLPRASPSLRMIFLLNAPVLLSKLQGNMEIPCLFLALFHYINQNRETPLHLLVHFSLQLNARTISGYIKRIEAELADLIMQEL